MARSRVALGRRGLKENEISIKELQLGTSQKGVALWNRRFFKKAMKRIFWTVTILVVAAYTARFVVNDLEHFSSHSGIYSLNKHK
jgi:hypothetical protein